MAGRDRVRGGRPQHLHRHAPRGLGVQFRVQDWSRAYTQFDLPTPSKIGARLCVLDNFGPGAEALGGIAAPASVPAIRALAEDYPEVSTRRRLLESLEACLAAGGQQE